MKQIQTTILGLAIGILLIVYILCTQLAAEQARMAGEEWRETCEPRAIEIIRAESPREAAYARESTVTVTAYCPCEKCCGEYANGYTATGAKATQGVTIATDPDVIPMGTEVEIDGHIYIAQDVGGAISGNRIDLYFDSHEDALQWGVREKIARWNDGKNDI